jgi:diketogulonate reductase-like aldo/keto reductase
VSLDRLTFSTPYQRIGLGLAAVGRPGCAVIVKEALANGRLVNREETLARICAQTGATPDAVALAAALHQPWVTVVLSGASTTAQLAANLEAATLDLDRSQLGRLATLAEPPARYWQHRSGLPWN